MKTQTPSLVAVADINAIAAIGLLAFFRSFFSRDGIVRHPPRRGGVSLENALLAESVEPHANVRRGGYALE